jgi:RNA polymerase sigma factor for flagellar operon FliA
MTTTTLERGLWQRYREQGDPIARERLLDRHLGLVHHIVAQRHARMPGWSEFEDLIGAGTLGLIKALETFDPARGHEFSTYAIPRIRGAILDDLRQRDGMPRSVRQKKRRIDTAVQRLEARDGGVPAPVAVAECLGIDLATYWRWQHAVDSAAQVSLEGEEGRTEDQAPLQALIPDPTVARADDLVIEQEERASLAAAMAELSERERTVLALYYYEELTLRQIAEVLHVTESRVSQIRSQAARRLRGILAENAP